jgi:excisionase family DNA binding protein
MAIDLTTRVGDLTVEQLLELLSISSQPKPLSCPKKLLSVGEVAELLGYKVSNIYALTHRREIPFMKKGRKLWFKEDEIQEWVKSGRKKTVTELQESLKVKHGKIITNP